MSQTAAETTETTTPQRRRRWPRVLGGLAVLLIVGLIGVELVARFGLGLGDPPLSVADDEIEYLFKPGQYSRFGNTVGVNQWSMRSPEFAAEPAEGELRVLVIGDSVPNGGSQTDDADLATTLLQRELADGRGGPATVANVSAGSWGPPNQLAYVRRFGTFGADAAVVVLNVDDARDVPGEVSPVGRDPSYPDRAPITATGELFDRYLLPRLFGPGDAAPAEEPDALDEAEALAALGDLLDLLKERGVAAAVVYWPTQDEVTAGPRPARDLLANVAAERGVPFVDAAPFVTDPAADYRDPIHPSVQGQRALQAVLKSALEAAGIPLTSTPKRP